MKWGSMLFLERRIRFDQIHALNVETLSSYLPQAPGALEDLLAIDQESRKVAQSLIAKLH